MRCRLWILLLAALAAPAHVVAAEGLQVRLRTNLGEIVLELDRDKAPETVQNFLRYVHDGYYNGTIFHRVISDFMIQGGGYTRDYRPREARPPIRNEADNGLRNVRGSVAMARTSDPHSATSQFFINVKDNPFLDHRERSPKGWGYAVFGRVVSGMEVVDRIRELPTGRAGIFPADVPRSQVIIEQARLKGEGG